MQSKQFSLQHEAESAGGNYKMTTNFFATLYVFQEVESIPPFFDSQIGHVTYFRQEALANMRLAILKVCTIILLIYFQVENNFL